MSTVKKILIADDEPDILEIIQYNLQAEGFEVITAKNGNEAIEKATFVQRNFLAQKKKRNKVEDFEYLILRMVHPDPSKRGSASSLLNEMKVIINK